MADLLMTLLPPSLVHAAGVVARMDRARYTGEWPRGLVLIRTINSETVEVSGTDGYAAISVEVTNGVGVPDDDEHQLFRVVEPPSKKPSGLDANRLQAIEIAPLEQEVKRSAAERGLELFERSQEPGSLDITRLDRLMRAFRYTGVTIAGLQSNRDAVRITAANRWGKSQMVGYLAGVASPKVSHEA